MPTLYLLLSRALKPNPLTIVAAISLTAGCLVYLFTRSTTPELIHNVSSFVGTSARSSLLFSIPWAYQLPSFFHTLALMLLTAAIVKDQPRLKAVALTFTFILGLLMELVQHPVVSHTISSCTGNACSLWSDLETYARTGTFDPLDLLAITFAAAVALTTVTLISLRSKYNARNRI